MEKPIDRKSINEDEDAVMNNKTIKLHNVKDDTNQNYETLNLFTDYNFVKHNSLINTTMGHGIFS